MEPARRTGGTGAAVPKRVGQALSAKMRDLDASAGHIRGSRRRDVEQLRVAVSFSASNAQRVHARQTWMNGASAVGRGRARRERDRHAVAGRRRGAAVGKVTRTAPVDR
jgi:hypothetical protein